MNWTIKKGLFKSTLHGTTSGMGLFIYHKGDNYSVIDDSRKTVFSISQKNDLEYKIEENDGTQLLANMVIDKQAINVYPPRILLCDVKMNNVTYKIKQLTNRDFVIYENEVEVGNITNSLNPNVRMQVKDTIVAVNVAMIYALSLIMLHSDDIDIV